MTKMCKAEDREAYIPALPTNSSQEAIAGGLNVTDISKLEMFWYSQGCVLALQHTSLISLCPSSYSQFVSYQLAGNGTTGISKVVSISESQTKGPYIVLCPQGCSRPLLRGKGEQYDPLK